MNKYPKEISEVLEGLYTKYGICSDDLLGKSLLLKSLEGSYAYKQSLKVNEILLGDIPPDIEHKSGIYEKLIFSSIEGEFYRNYYLPIWGWLCENFIKGMIKQSYSPDTCQRIIQNFKNVQIGFTYSGKNEKGGGEQKDPLGMVRYTFDTKEIDLNIYLHQIIDSYGDMIILGDMHTNYKNIFIGVLLHELAHLISTETFDTINAQNSQKLFELQGKESNLLSAEEMLTLMTYRSGYSLHLSDGSEIDPTSINEAITELIAAEWFHLLQQETDIVTKGMEYQIAYTKEVSSFQQVLQEFADKTGQDYDNLFGIIKTGYIAGGQAMQTAISDVLDHIMDPFDELLEKKRSEKLHIRP